MPSADHPQGPERLLLLRGDVQGAADQFGKWVNAGGKQLPGLVARRQAERALFQKE